MSISARRFASGRRPNRRCGLLCVRQKKAPRPSWSRGFLWVVFQPARHSLRAEALGVETALEEAVLRLGEAQVVDPALIASTADAAILLVDPGEGVGACGGDLEA